MSWIESRIVWAVLFLAVAAQSGGCGPVYKGVVRPTVQMGALSPELAELSDAKIEQYLKANPRPSFPSVLAIARLAPSNYYQDHDSRRLDVIQGDEAAAWRRMAERPEKTGKSLIDQVHLISPVLVSAPLNMKRLRDAAARLHAPILLVYSQADTRDHGYNSAAVAYWTIVGLFLVPGDTVGHYTACYGVLVDTRTGGILATIEGESKYEEHVLPGVVRIVKRRAAKQAGTEAIARFQESFSETLNSLAASAVASGRQTEPPGD